MKKYTKKSFLSELKKRLNLKFSAKETTDILLDYAEIFDFGITEGKSEEEIIEKLNSPKEIVRELANQSQNPTKKAIGFFKNKIGKTKFTKKYIVIFAILALLAFLLFAFSVFCTYQVTNLNSWISLFPKPEKIGLLYSALYNFTIFFICLLWIYEIFLFINFGKIKKTIISFSFINLGMIITTICFTNLLSNMDNPNSIFIYFLKCLYGFLICFLLSIVAYLIIRIIKSIKAFPKNKMQKKI